MEWIGLWGKNFDSVESVSGRPKKWDLKKLCGKIVAAVRSYDKLTHYKCYFRTKKCSHAKAETLAHMVIVVAKCVTTVTIGYCRCSIINKGHTWLL